MKEKESTIIVLAVVAAIVVLEALALRAGIDGSLLALSFIVLGGIGGFEIKGLLKWLQRGG